MGRTDIIHGDRRDDRRYECELELHFSYKLGGTTYFGSGHTVDMSRTAICFIADDPPPPGADLELRISWPFLLQNVCPLELLVRGTASMTATRGTVLAISHYEFRTCGQRSFAQAASAAGGNSFLA
jgi:hypothetical protein